MILSWGLLNIAHCLNNLVLCWRKCHFHFRCSQCKCPTSGIWDLCLLQVIKLMHNYPPTLCLTKCQRTKGHSTFVCIGCLFKEALFYVGATLWLYKKPNAHLLFMRLSLDNCLSSVRAALMIQTVCTVTVYSQWRNRYEKYPRISIIRYVSSLYLWTIRKSIPIFPSFRAICLRRRKFIGNHSMLFQTWNWNIVKWKLPWKLEWAEKFNHIYLNFVNVLFNFRMYRMANWKIKKKKCEVLNCITLWDDHSYFRQALSPLAKPYLSLHLCPSRRPS